MMHSGAGSVQACTDRLPGFLDFRARMGERSGGKDDHLPV